MARAVALLFLPRPEKSSRKEKLKKLAHRLERAGMAARLN
jgi:hypothetical protein